MKLRPKTLLREIALTAAAIIGVVTLAGALAAVIWGVRPLVFISNSMSPDIPVGSLALAKNVPADLVKVGDVVSTQSPLGDRVTHRVVDIKQVAQGLVELTLKGDANNEADQTPYRVAQVDRVVWSVPRLGWLVIQLQHPAVIFACGAVAGAWVTWWMRPRQGRGNQLVRGGAATVAESKCGNSPRG